MIEEDMQKIGRFFTRAKFRPLPAVIMLVIWVLFCTLGGVFCLLPAVGLMLSAYVCCYGARAGRIPAFVAILLAAVLGFLFGGWITVLCVLLVLLPPVLFSYISQDARWDFWQSVGICVGIIFAGGMAVVLIAWYLVGGDLVRAMRDGLEQMLLASSGQALDQLLYAMYTSGMLQLPEGMRVTLQLGGVHWFNPVARGQLMRSLLLMVEEGLRYWLPMQLISAPILSGVLCIALPRWVQRSKMEERDEAPVPPFSTWALPRTMGRMVAVTLLVIGFMMLMSSGSVFYGAYVALWAGVKQVMLLQGAATVSFLLKKSGTVKRGGRIAIVVALALLVSDLLWIIGCVDQFLDLRKLRLPIEKNEGEDDQ